MCAGRAEGTWGRRPGSSGRASTQGPLLDLLCAKARRRRWAPDRRRRPPILGMLARLGQNRAQPSTGRRIVAAVAARDGLAGLFGRGARVTDAAHRAWADVLRPGDFVVDATVGNGADTLFLARAVGPDGHVLGLDVQAEATSRTRARLAAACEPLAPVTLVKACHSTLGALLDAGAGPPPALVAFNLGYLPSSCDKGAVTTPATTLAALDAATSRLAPGGMISVCSYTGHPGGQAEADAVRAALSALPPDAWVVVETRLLNRGAPLLTLAWRADE